MDQGVQHDISKACVAKTVLIVYDHSLLLLQGLVSTMNLNGENNNGKNQNYSRRNETKHRFDIFDKQTRNKICLSPQLQYFICHFFVCSLTID